MLKHLLSALLLALPLCIKSQQKNNLVAKYTFNKAKALNEAGLQQPKVSGVSFVEDRFGNDNAAVYLHGNKNSYVNLGTDSILKPRQASISMWVNIDVIIYKGEEGWNYNPILTTKNKADKEFIEGYFIGFNFDAKKLNVTTSLNQQNQITLNTRHSFSVGKWHHIVMTYDDDSLGLYVDNNLQARLKKNFRSEFLTGDSVVIGNMANYENQRYLCGSVDDIHIYSRVITPEEVGALYNAPDPNKFNSYIKWFYLFLAFVASVSILVWLLLRKFKADFQRQKEKSQANARMNELETKAIRTQMNPHFIFNSLNTLQRFILEADVDNANFYLIKFSKLLRKLLESSAAESISLKEEIEILNNYIELEKLRFDKSFDYTVNSAIQLPESIQIPFMLIQPFVENAIWHGLLPKKGSRLLEIDFYDIDEFTLLCRVSDNGVGRKYSFKQHDPFKKKSMAIDFIGQRLNILTEATGIKCYIKIVDKENERGESEGTDIEIIIPKIK